MSLTKEKQRQIISAIMRSVIIDDSVNVQAISAKFGITRQTVYSYIKKLINEKKIEKSNNEYSAVQQFEKRIEIDVVAENDEDKIYSKYIEPILPENLKQNVWRILRFGFTEMFNNVIDHSESSDAVISIVYYESAVLIAIADHGIGIFEKVQKALGLESPRESILELAKGKFTSDTVNHTGQGIFFTSRIFDFFGIYSKELFFSSNAGKDTLDINGKLGFTDNTGTIVFMLVFTDTDRTTGSVFSQYSLDDEMTFDKTEVNLAIMSEDGHDLISRTQARRLLASLDKFKVVTLDFSGIEEIGISFADEIFRVFKNANPDTLIMPVNCKHAVEKIINRAKNWEK